MASLILLFISLFHITGTLSSVLPGETQPSVTCNSCCQGTAGLNGVPGVPGVPGRDGLRGEMGLKGEAGEPGFIGSSGLPGPQGPVGERGERGDPGLQGLPGKVGPRGLEGQPGADGRPGLDGERGADGLKGSKGEPGGGTTEVRRSAFSVFKSSSQTGNTNDVVTFEREESNVGSHFSMSTDKFTCQIPGTYVFMFTIFVEYDSQDPCIVLVVDNRLIARADIDTASDRSTHNHRQHSNSAIVQLSTGTEVWLKFCRGDEVCGVSGKYTSFSGFLLYPE